MTPNNPKSFETHSAYNTYINSQDKLLPNVSYCENENEVHYNPWYDPERFVAKFNVTTTTSSTSLFNNPTLLSKIEIDGVEYTGNDIYSHYNHTFSTTGIHTVKYTLNDGVTSIDIGSFASKYNMVSITIPDTITTIGGSAFASCSSLTNINIPSSVTTIGNAAFSGSNFSFEDIIFEAINPNATFSVDTTNKIITNATGDTLLCGFYNTVAIPSTVTTIGNAAFSGCSSLTSITIPNSVTTIGDAAFSGCSSLTNIIISSSVTSIGTNPFYNCSGLTDIVVDSNNTTYDSRSNCNAIIETSANNLIVGCKNSVIPSGVTSINNSAFQGCSGLTSITIPNSVTSIGQYAFQGCTGLTSITSLATTAPTVTYLTFENVKTGGTLYVPTGATGYDNTWMSPGSYYLGKYNWTKVEQ